MILLEMYGNGRLKKFLTTTIRVIIEVVIIVLMVLTALPATVLT